jgi:signal transduction histidine kinase
VAAAQSAVQRVAEPAGLAYTVTSRGAEPKELGETASVALRLIQEALTNAVRHAQASFIAVRLRFLPQGRIGVLVVDDGVGFDKHALLDGPQSERNVGLYGMIERTELAGGRLLIRTAPGKGVAVRAIL